MLTDACIGKKAGYEVCIEDCHLQRSESVSVEPETMPMSAALIFMLAPTAPYVAGNFATYEIIRGYMTSESGEPPGTLGKLLAGALAGSISQTVSGQRNRPK